MFNFLYGSYNPNYYLKLATHLLACFLNDVISWRRDWSVSEMSHFYINLYESQIITQMTFKIDDLR